MFIICKLINWLNFKYGESFPKVFYVKVKSNTLGRRLGQFSINLPKLPMDTLYFSLFVQFHESWHISRKYQNSEQDHISGSYMYIRSNKFHQLEGMIKGSVKSKLVYECGYWRFYGEHYYDDDDEDDDEYYGPLQLKSEGPWKNNVYSLHCRLCSVL